MGRLWSWFVTSICGPEKEREKCPAADHDFEVFVIENGQMHETNQQQDGDNEYGGGKTGTAITKTRSEVTALIFCNRCGEVRDVTPEKKRKTSPHEPITA